MGTCALRRLMAGGEPEEETGEAVIARLQARVHARLADAGGLQFDGTGAGPAEASRAALGQVAGLLGECPALGLKIVCYTQSSEEALELSRLRAQSVKEVLEQAGCENLTSATGMGHVDGCGDRVELTIFLPDSVEMTEATVAEAGHLLGRMRAEVDDKVGLRLAGSVEGATRFVDWNTKAKVEAQFAYMTALLAMPEFVAVAEAELHRSDSDGSGALDCHELAPCVHELVQRHSWDPASKPVGAKLTDMFFKKMDRDCNGLVSRAEFLAYLAHFHYECYFRRVETPEPFEALEVPRPDRSRRRSRKQRRSCC
mmetsp:Transcript_25413/g.73292  ORF Transcript_25413/g.73292 Transcript_25413/m.73292 type:complete len:313 (-) Transcript_25413:245-1183(-)